MVDKEKWVKASDLRSEVFIGETIHTVMYRLNKWFEGKQDFYVYNIMAFPGDRPSVMVIYNPPPEITHLRTPE